MVRTTGNRAPQIKMSEKERINPIFACIFSYNRAASASRSLKIYCINACTLVQASKLSAQSPACSKNASLRWTAPSWCRKRSIYGMVVLSDRTIQSLWTEPAYLRSCDQRRECADLREHSVYSTSASTHQISNCKSH